MISALDGVSVSATCRPLYSSERDPAPILQEAGWTSGPFCAGMGSPSLSVFEPRTLHHPTSRYMYYAITSHSL